MKHVLKIQKVFWDDIQAGLKTFEVRFNDRNFKLNDIISFVVINKKEIIENPKEEFKINYILDYPVALKKNYLILGIKAL